MRPYPQRRAPRNGPDARFRISGERIVERTHSPGRQPPECFGTSGRDVGKADTSGEKCRDRDFVGRIEDRRRRAAGCQRPRTRALRQGKRDESGASNESEPGARDRVPARLRRCDRETRAPARSACACPDSRAARAPSHRRIRPANGSRSCGWITTSICSGGTPNSQCASITSRPLFIIVAESTEILRPITQLGCAHASSGVTCGSSASGRVRKGPPGCGEQDPPHARRAGRARSARQALEDRVVLAVDRQQRRAAVCDGRHEDGPTDHERLLVREQNALARGGRRQRRAQSRRTDDGRKNGVGRRQRRGFDDARFSGDNAGRKTAPRQSVLERARRGLGSTAPRRRAEIAGTTRELFPLPMRGERRHREPVAMAGDDVERRVADRAGGAEYADPSRHHRR